MKHTLLAVLVLLSFIVLPLSANRDWVYFKAKTPGAKVLIDLTHHTVDSVYLQYYNQYNKTTKQWDQSMVGTWTKVTTSTTITLTNAGDSVLVRGHNPRGLNRVFSSQNKYVRFQITAQTAEVGGDIMSLIDTTATTLTMVPNEYCFYRLFECATSNLVSAEHLRLPPTTYAKCYWEMFSGCQGLETGPDMTATQKIRIESCRKMFYHCRALTAAPAMPNLVLVGENGCNSMFEGCWKLTYVPDLVAPYTDDYSYQNMFFDCINLENAPRILAEEMHVGTCKTMFSGCKKLKYVPHLTALYLDDHCYESMFESCSTLVDAPAILATELGYTYNGKSYNYKSCFKWMFKGCTSLKSIEVYFSKWGISDDNDPTGAWVQSVPETTEGVFSAPCGLNDERGQSRIPKKWQFNNCFICYTFDVETNGGVWADNNDNISRTFKDTINLVPVTTKKNAVFVEWNTQKDGQGQTWNPSAKPSEHTTYYAIYQSTGEEEEEVFGTCLEYTNFSKARIDTAWTTGQPDGKNQYHWSAWRTPSESLDYGPRRKFSRWSVHTNPAEVDARTAGELFTTYQGHPTVRLGNWENHTAEQMTYTYEVPADKPILLLHYAAVLEDPKHKADEQPRFTLEMLKSDGTPLDDCFSFDFVSGASLGDKTWNIEDDICWKDWTTMGVNLGQHIGEKLNIRLTTYDCIQGGHFGYAYFALDCRDGQMKTLSCGASAESTFRAPDGFKYKWYVKGDPSQVVGTEQVLTVKDAQGKTYMCDVINPEKEDCYFTLEAVPETRYPLAIFDTLPRISDGKVDKITVTNSSCVSNDGVNPKVPFEAVDSCSWIVTNAKGEVVFTSNATKPEILLTAAGQYTITLQTFLNHGECGSPEVTKTLTVKRSGGISYVSQDTTLCADSELQTWKSHPLGKMVKLSNILYHDTVFSGSPQDTVVYILNIHRQYVAEDPTTATVQKGHTYEWKIDGVTYQSYTPTKEETITDERMDYYTTGCDSMHHTLTLTVTGLPVKEMPDTTCENVPYTWQGHGDKFKDLTKADTYRDTTHTAGLDTIHILYLTVNDTIHTIDHLTKTDGDFPFMWNGTLITSAAQTGAIANLHRQATGCDSIVTLDLKVISTCAATARLTSSTLCADTAAMGVVLECTKGQITQYEVTFDAAAQGQQFQGTTKTISLSAGQTENISLPVPHAPSSVSPNGQSYPRPDRYMLTLKATTSCDSVITFALPFEVLYPASIIMQRWNDVLALTNERYNGGYTFSKIVWYNEGQTIVGSGEHNSYHYVQGDNTQTLNMGTNYWAELTRTDDGKTICTCKLRPQISSQTGTRFAAQLQVATRRGTISLTSNYSGSYIVYDICGRQLISGHAEASDLSQVIMTNVTSGTYVVSYKGDNGEHDVKKVFVE